MPRLLSVITLCFLAAFPLSAQSVGPDIRIAEIYEILNYAHDPAAGVDVFSVGTQACNIGDANMLWLASTSDHPVISQQVYRLAGGRFEQIGMSWVRHPFFAASQGFCGSCNGVFGNMLGAGCSDESTAGLNGQQASMSPRSDVEPTTVAYAYPPGIGPHTGGIERRLRIKLSDLGVAGARYFVEVQYLAADDAAAGNAANNVSWREVGFTASGGGYDMTFLGPTHVGEPAIQAWAEIDPEVRIETLTAPGGGLCRVAFKHEDLEFHAVGPPLGANFEERILPDSGADIHRSVLLEDGTLRGVQMIGTNADFQQLVNEIGKPWGGFSTHA